MYEVAMSMGFQGFKYERGKHFALPVFPDGSPSQLIDGKNLYHDVLGLKTFMGCEKLFATQMGADNYRNCVGVFPYQGNDGNIYVIFCFPTKIYKYKVGDATPTEIQGAVTLTGGNTDYFTATYWADTSTGYNPWIVLSNGKDPAIKWTGTGNCAALGGTPPNGKYITSFAGHLFASYVTSGANIYSQRDQWSDVDKAEDWSLGLAGSNDLRQSAGAIVGDVVYGGLRFIIKEFSTTVCRNTGYDPPFIYEEDELPIGGLAPATIIKCAKYDYGFFMGHDKNIYLIRRDGTYFAIGDDIVDYLRSLTNDNKIRYSFAVYHPGLDQVLLAYPTDNTDDFCPEFMLFDMGYFVATGNKVWSTPIRTGHYWARGAPTRFRRPYTIEDLAWVSTDGKIGGIAGTIGELYQEAAFNEIVMVDNQGYAFRFDAGLPTFEGALGSDKIANGHFDTDTGWVKGTGWTIASGVASSDGSQVANSYLYEADKLEIGKTYRVTFRVTARTAGNVRVEAGSGSGTWRSAIGVYTEDLVCATTTNAVVTADLNFVGSVDDVSFVEITDNIIGWEAEFKDNHFTQEWVNKFRLLEYELYFRNPGLGPSAIVVGVSTDGGKTFNNSSETELYSASGAGDEELGQIIYVDYVGKKHRIKITGTYPIKLLGQSWRGTREGDY